MGPRGRSRASRRLSAAQNAVSRRRHRRAEVRREHGSLPMREEPARDVSGRSDRAQLQFRSVRGVEPRKNAKDHRACDGEYRGLEGYMDRPSEQVGDREGTGPAERTSQRARQRAQENRLAQGLRSWTAPTVVATATFLTEARFDGKLPDVRTRFTSPSPGTRGGCTCPPTPPLSRASIQA